jgi:hypothetical protein
VDTLGPNKATPEGVKRKISRNITQIFNDPGSGLEAAAFKLCEST